MKKDTSTPLSAELFNFKLPKDKRQKVAIKDIQLVHGYENETFMLESLGNLGLLDDNIYLIRNPGKKYNVIDGKRRLLALKEAGATHINALVFRSIDDYKAAMVTLATNNARGYNPIAELEAIQVLEKRGIKPSLMRKYANVSKSKVSKLKTLLKLHKELFQAFKRNKLTFTVAYEIAKMPDAMQTKLARIFKENGTITGEDMKGIKKKQKEKLAQMLPDELFEVPEFDRVMKLVNEYFALSLEEKQRFIKETT